MNARNIIAIARKDLIEVGQNRFAWTPMVIVPLLFVIIMPLALILIPPNAGIQVSSLSSDADLKTFLTHMPPSMTAALSGLNEFQSILLLVLGYMLAPMFLMFPLMFSTIIASESFAGEKERKTLEALLYTPASDTDLFLGKVMVAMIPAIAISWGSFLVYTMVLNLAGYSVFGHFWFPLPTWYPLIFWITPALALLGVSFTVLISSRTETFMSAYQSSASLVILVLGLVIGQATGLLYFTVGVGMLVGVVFWIAAAVLTMIAVRMFRRSNLLVHNK
jgi:ABC-2 type transport system permease protein